MAYIPVSQWRWSVKRIEDFIKAQNDRRIKALSGADITAYLESPGVEKRLKGRQYRPCVNAIRILYCDLLLTTAAEGVDWYYWSSSARDPETDHPSTAHPLTPDELQFLKERSRGTGPINQAAFPVSGTAGTAYHRDPSKRLFLAYRTKRVPLLCLSGIRRTHGRF